MDLPAVADRVAGVFGAWAWLFGSVARDTQTRRGEVDIMMELDVSSKLGFSYLTLEDGVADTLGCRVHFNTLVRESSTPAFMAAFDRDKVAVFGRAAG